MHTIQIPILVNLSFLLGLLLIVSVNCNQVTDTRTGQSLELETDKSYSMSLTYDQHYVLNISLTSKDTRAIVLYAITQGCNVTVSLNENFSLTDSIRGSSVGIIKLAKRNSSSLLLYLKIESLMNCTNSSEDVDLILLKQTSVQPIPGGCNLVHNADYYPLLTSNIDNFLWHLSFEPANIGFSFDESEPLCDVERSPNKRLVYDVYVSSLSAEYKNQTCCRHSKNCEKQHSNTSLESFSHILTQDENGYKLNSLTHNSTLDFSITYNPCSNSIIHVVVRDPMFNTSSSYAPLLVLRSKLRTGDAASVYLHVIMIILIIASFILCFIGHRLFIFEVFSFCSLFFMLGSFIALNCTTSFELSDKLALSSGIGIFFGLFFAALWWRFGRSELFCFFISVVGGYLLASILFVSPLINLAFFRNYWTFVAFFALVVSIYVLIFVVISLSKFCIATSALVGSYLLVFGLSSGVYFCSQLSLIVPYSLLRISNKKFYDAFVVFHFSTVDIAMLVSWIVFFMVGIVVQSRLHRSQPDFPQSPYKKKTRQRQSVESLQASTETDTLSSRGPSFTSENYEGDVSDELLNSVEFPQYHAFSNDTTLLIND